MMFTIDRTKIVFTLLLCVIGVSVSGQDMTNHTFDEKNTWQLFTYDLGNIFKGVGHSYTRPLHWQGKHWATAAGVGAVTGISYVFDDQTTEFFAKQGDDIPEFLKTYGEKYGSPQVNYMFTGGLYLTGLFAKDEKLRRTGVLLIASATSAGLLQQVLKSAVGRVRPESGRSKDTFDPFNSDRSYHSFPSGHAMLAFTNAYAIAKQFKSPWVKGGLYAVGLVPGVSRLWDNQHWFSDLVFGIAVSIFTVESIDKYLDRKYDEKYNDQAKKLSWDLNFAPGQVGVTMRF